MTVIDVSDAGSEWCYAKPRAYSVAVRDQFRAIGAAWEPDAKRYRVPAEALRIVLRRLREARVAVAAGIELQPPGWQIAEDPVFGIVDGHDDLYTYQRDGIGFIVDRLRATGAALLADDPGLGKSAQALRALLDVGAQRVAIVCPAVVQRHWLEQHKRWGGPHTLNVCSYDKLRIDHTRGGSPLRADAVILDEIHYISSARAKRSIAARQLVEQTPRPLVVGLSGTPMLVRPRDLWHPLDVLWPGRFAAYGLIGTVAERHQAAYYRFSARYCNGRMVRPEGLDRDVWEDDGSSNTAELRERLGAVMLRRARSEVLASLPERQRIVLPIDLPREARQQLRDLAVSITGAESVTRLLGHVEEHKLSAAEQLVTELREAGRRVLVFTTRRRSAERLAAKLGVPCVTGEMVAGKRVAALDGVDCAVATLWALTTGVDLTQFDVAVFVGLDWVPSTLLQAEARLARIGQRSACSFYYLVGIGTIDEVVRERVIERLETFDAVVGGGAEGTGLASALGDSDESLLAEIVRAVGKTLQPERKQ